MLCYLSTRSASDVIHDAFLWLTNNIKAILVAFVPISVVCLLCLVSVGFSVDIDSYSSIYALFDTLADYGQSSKTGVYAYAIMAFATTLCIVPVIDHYFCYRHTLRGFTLMKEAEALRRCMLRAVIAAALMGILVYGLYELNIWLMLLVTVIFIFIVPCVIMSNAKGFSLSGKFGSAIRAALSIILVCAVVWLLPVICYTLIYMAFDMLMTAMPGHNHVAIGLDSVIEIVMSIFNALALCSSVIVFLVTSLMLHGVVVSDY